MAGLAERTAEFTSAEAEIAALGRRLATVEQAVTQGSQEVETVTVQTPVSEEALAVNFREQLAKIAVVETDSQVQGLDEQMLLKSGEIAMKEAYLQHIRDCAGHIRSAKSEYEFLLTDFQVSVASEAANVLVHVKDMHSLEERTRETLSEALVESQVIEKTAKKAKNRLIDELNRTVEKAMKEAKGEIEVKGKLSELDFSLELGLLTLSLRTVQTGREDLRQELQALEAAASQSEEALREATGAFASFATDTESRGSAFAQSYQQAQASEKPALLTLYKGEFDYRLEGGMKIIAKLISSIEARQSLLSALLKQLETGGLAKGSDLTVKVARASTRLHSSSQSLLTEAELQASRLQTACGQATKVGSAALATLTPNPADETPNSHSTPASSRPK